MKKFITILISCSLAAGAMAQQEDQEPTPKKKKHDNAQAAQGTESPTKPDSEPPAARPHAAKKAKEPAAATDTTKTQAPAEESVSPTPAANAQPGRHKKDRNAAKAPATAKESASPTNAVSPTPATASAGAGAQTAAAPQPNKPNAGTNKVSTQSKKPDVQAIKAQHANFHAQPKPQQVPAVTFNQNVRINGSEHWQGEQYAVFRSYHPQMHDQNFYRSHYSRVELIGGGYYYLDGGYWYPAWGYQPSASYYVYDGPIYAGAHAEPPDKVIADVQASLLELGYYKGEVDGLLGPLTRQALTGYQSDNGLVATAAIDQPTLASLGLG